MPKGRIKRLVSDRGFGFIQPGEGADLFFHSSEVQGAVFTSLREGQEVEYEVGKGRDGRAQAVKVRLTHPESA
jgi:CspA family cold shock protein